MTLANATELTKNIISKVMGKEVANTLNGSVVNNNVLTQVISTRIGNKFNQVTNI